MRIATLLPCQDSQGVTVKPVCFACSVKSILTLVYGSTLTPI